MIEIWMKHHLLSDNIYNVVNPKCPIHFYKEWRILLGLHLVLVTLHRQFMSKIEQDKENW
jgi:hypothetical protein